MKTRHKNIVTTFLITMLNKTTKALQKTNIDLLKFLKDVLILANRQIEKELKEVKGTPETAQQDIKTLDRLVFALQSVFDILFDLLTETERNTILPEYQKFIDNLNEYRDDLQLLTNTEFWNEVNKIYNGTYNPDDYTTYNADTFWK